MTDPPDEPATAPARDTGSAAVELTLLAPLVVLLLLLIAAAARGTDARGQVDAAAEAAARAASAARSPAEATTAARAAAEAGLAVGSAACRTMHVTVDLGAFTRGGLARATVSCRVDFADLAGLRLPAGRTLTSTATSPLDVYRAVA
ncbi:TadE-like protein [Frankia canadensis]|uniref:TadE-like protein n=1 Tax=Frankia canadensis TaxID=1836972 RepID=A0A2I2KX47_9ACTN|nr:TadE/TadG family type IV pilus assembly protein [Frankia canadensis]SNQ50244.1 TadE-like protein [Frankia canadensis]SOU57534.1 TadE-like protein [Frankia canadensis]